MPESFSEQQVAQLEERWRRDPGSRVFLQLAEELRRGGRLERAIEILRAGLLHHPNYLSAQVALGRCLSERGDHAAATEMLERAVAQDPAQLVASRLLIESYLALGDAARARARLDFYRLFSDRDEEIRQLDARVRDLESPPRPAPGPATPEPFGALGEVAAEPLEFAPPPRVRGRAEDPFGPLGAPRAATERLAAACRREAIFAVAAPAVAFELEPAAALEPEPAFEPEMPFVAVPADEPPLAVEPTAEVAPAPPAGPTPAEPRPWWVPAPEPSAPGTPPPAAASVPPAASAPPWHQPEAARALEAEAPLFAASFSPREIGAEVERETIEEPFDEIYSAAASGVPAPAPAASTASVTLAELYLEQGHLDEAERTFAAVLVDRPDDRGARDGLAAVGRRRARRAEVEAMAAWSPEPAAAAPEAPAGSLSRRKAGALRAYLDRLRRGAAARVS